MKCDLCDAVATVHFTDVWAGKGIKQERHLCEGCAAKIHGELVEKRRPTCPECGMPMPKGPEAGG